MMSNFMKLAEHHRVVGMCALAVLISYFDRVNISVAAVSLQQEFDWNEITKGMVLSSFFLGYISFQLVGALLVSRFGGRLTLGIAVFSWSLVTFFSPAAISISVGWLIATRVLLGMGEAIVFPASIALFRTWVPASELSRAVALLASAVPLGTVVGLASTGWLIQNAGWPSAFYVFAVIGLIWAAVWFGKGKEVPHPKNDCKESARFSCPASNGAGTPGALSNGIPWRTLLSSKSLWILVFNHFACNWTLYLLLSWLPSYFRNIHGLGLDSSSLYSAIPWLVMFLFTNASGWLADKMINSGISRLVVRKSMQCSGLLGSALLLWFLRDVGSAEVALLIVSAALAFIALTWAGYAPSYLEACPGHAEIVLAVGNTFATLPGIIGVFLAGLMIELSGNYDGVFMLSGLINVLAAIAWFYFWSDKPIGENEATKPGFVREN